jgi:hypothetical protein
MLVFGFIGFATGFSVAWIANPLLIAAYVLVPQVRNPWHLRWLLYLAISAMLSAVHLDSLITVDLLPFFALWLIAPVTLYLGLRRTRKRQLELLRADA